MYIKKSGVWIGSCVAPVLRDILRGHHDRLLASRLDNTVVTKVFVGDLLFLFDCAVMISKLLFSDVLELFQGMYVAIGFDA